MSEQTQSSDNSLTPAVRRFLEARLFQVEGEGRHNDYRNRCKIGDAEIYAQSKPAAEIAQMAGISELEVPQLQRDLRTLVTRVHEKSLVAFVLGVTHPPEESKTLIASAAALFLRGKQGLEALQLLFQQTVAVVAEGDADVMKAITWADQPLPCSVGVVSQTRQVSLGEPNAVMKLEEAVRGAAVDLFAAIRSSTESRTATRPVLQLQLAEGGFVNVSATCYARLG